MTKCLIGSKKKDNAPATFQVDAGVICFILNIDSPICSLLDKLPELFGKGWRDILIEVADSALEFVTANNVDTALFCANNPPPLPEDITYLEVFGLIASYIPPFPLDALASPLMNKITKFYLFSKWQEFCECKKEDEEEEEQNDADQFPVDPKLPRLELDETSDNPCPPNSARIGINSQLEELENIAQAAQAAATEENNIAREQVTRPNFESQIEDFIANYTDNIPIDLNYQIEEDAEAQPTPVENNIFRDSGCITAGLTQILGYQYGIKRFNVELRNTDGVSVATLSSVRIYQRPIRFRLNEISISNCNCEEEKPPKIPEFPSEDCDCIPIPPKEFCILFPDDPLCANVPDKEEEDCEEEPTAIEVDDYADCVGSKKTVYWRLK